MPHRIALVRSRLDLAQGGFARRVGVSRNIVINWERGHHRPRTDTLERIAAVGGVSVDWLLRGNGRPPRVARRDPEFGAAIALLRAAWREPTQRRRILRRLEALARAVEPPRPGAPSHRSG